MTATVDPLSVECPWCLTPAGEPCSSPWHRHVPVHARRKHMAFALAAHADPVLDDLGLGPVAPCEFCGVPGMPQRHRRTDAIAGHLAAGDDAETISEELGAPEATVAAVGEWMERWPGAWN